MPILFPEPTCLLDGVLVLTMRHVDSGSEIEGVLIFIMLAIMLVFVLMSNWKQDLRIYTTSNISKFVVFACEHLTPLYFHLSHQKNTCDRAEVESAPFEDDLCSLSCHGVESWASMKFCFQNYFAGLTTYAVLIYIHTSIIDILFGNKSIVS